ncbi:50S ribosomal protein L25/general stress protein Ctc [Salirhabdus sp. Marseille-P4669]|uniref:50S ribosomal protein L25/general stress protein Ctc n=1 Tax=Salirhabdus sp. Marseille-P4669 TaxID=2042310 RepID=UPI000C7A5C3F|nr:50S ribosomal protein L25/general stress protein Ctc [Salirhabdus sp. Marseille-P4669]
MAAILKAMERPDLRRSTTKALRNNGSIPAVVYGKGKQPITIAVDSTELVKSVRDNGRNAVFKLEVEGGDSVQAMLYEYQEDQLRNEIIHADFYQVDMSSEVEVEVPISLEGQEKIKDGIVQQTLHQLQVRAKPSDIPEFFRIDISDLQISDTLTIGDLLQENNVGFEILGDDSTVIVSILPPQQNSVDEPSMDGQAEEALEADQEKEEEENDKEK